MNFTSIDFETATGYRDSACAVGIVSVENSKIVNEYYSLIKPPKNYYWGKFTEIHGITSQDTINAPNFNEIYPKIKELLSGKTIIAHNEAFDRGVLSKTMELYGLNYSDLELANMWECTVKICRAKGYRPCTLNACCERANIELVHHEALSDARAAAKLYMWFNAI